MFNFLYIKFVNGEEWEINADPIAADRASFYAKKEAGENGKTYEEIFKTEYEYMLSNKDELINWMYGNMDAGNVESFSIQIKPPYKLGFRELLSGEKIWIKAK
jgi:hypothetical protein